MSTITLRGRIDELSAEAKQEQNTRAVLALAWCALDASILAILPAGSREQSRRLDRILDRADGLAIPPGFAEDVRWAISDVRTGRMAV